MAPVVEGRGQASSAAVSSSAGSEPRVDIRYRLVRAEGKDGALLVGLFAERAGRSVPVLPVEERCLDLVHQGDLDDDGLADALVEHTTACGGNGAPSEYSFVPGTRGEFREQTLGTNWSAPTVESWHGRPSVLLESNNEGSHLGRPERTEQRFVFEKGRAVLVEEKRAVETKALVELRSEHFEGAAPEEERSLSFDLDGDEKADRLVAKLWERWGRMRWRVRFGRGEETKGSDLACKRIGVLREKTSNHHDLVCDFDTRLRWNGNAYLADSKTD